MNIRLARYDIAPLHRYQGTEIRHVIETTRDRLPVTIDFLGVRSISHAFADACLGGLVWERGYRWVRNNIKCVNMNKDVSHTIGLVLRNQRAFDFPTEEPAHPWVQR